MALAKRTLKIKKKTKREKKKRGKKRREAAKGKLDTRYSMFIVIPFFFFFPPTRHRYAVVRTVIRGYGRVMPRLCPFRHFAFAEVILIDGP